MGQATITVSVIQSLLRLACLALNSGSMIELEIKSDERSDSAAVMQIASTIRSSIPSSAAVPLLTDPQILRPLI